MANAYEILLNIGGKISNTFTKSTSQASKSLEGIEKTAEKVSGGVSKGFGSIKGAALGLAGAITGGAGLFELADKAVEAGNGAYELSQKMHVSSAEALNLSRMLKLTNTDTQPFVSTMLRLDKGLESAGKKGNATTKALAQFGVKLTDSHGKLLPMNDQLGQLAKAYQKAAASGNEEAFTASVLGARGASLTGILADYKEAAEQASQVKGVGIDPELAHKVSMEVKTLKSQIAQFGYVAGAAVMPIVQKMIPPLQAGLGGIANFVKSHQPDLKQMAQTITGLGVNVVTAVTPLVKGLLPVVGQAFNQTLGFLKNSLIPAIGQALKNVIPVIAQIAKQALPLIMGGLKTAGSLVKWFGQNIKLVIPIVGGLAAAVGAYKVAQLAVNAAQKAGMIIQALSKAWGVAATLIGLLREGESLAAVAQLALNMAMDANPAGVVALAIIALIGVGVLLYKNWGTISKFLLGAWEGLKTGAESAFGAIGKFVGSVFEGLWGGIKSYVNLYIGAINLIIKGLDSLKVPKISIPGIGSIGGWGINIPQIPKLAQGGIVKHRPGGILANIGEGNYDEAITPLKPGGPKPGAGDTYIFAPVYHTGASKEDVKDATEDAQREWEKRMDIWKRNKKRVSFA